MGEYIPSAPINDEAKKANGNLPGMGGVFNVVNLHLYHYAGNNPVKYTDPDGKFMTQKQYTKYICGQIAATGHAFRATVNNIFGKAGNFFANIFTGKADIAVSLNSTLKIEGTPLNGTVSLTSDGGIQFSTSIDDSSDFAGALLDLAGLPLKISANGIELGLGTMSVQLGAKGENATVNFQLKSKNYLKGLDLSMGLKLTASTEIGPHGTIDNGKNSSLNDDLKAATYYNSTKFFLDTFF